MANFWMPSRKWQFFDWFHKNRPYWRVESWPLAKLRAVYIKERKSQQ